MGIFVDYLAKSIVGYERAFAVAESGNTMVHAFEIKTVKVNEVSRDVEIRDLAPTASQHLGARSKSL